MKTIFKILGILLLLLLLLAGIFYLLKNEQEPVGSEEAKADIMAERMLKVINVEAWNELPRIGWTFAGRHTFDWNKEQNIVQVSWPNYQVTLDLTTKDGTVYHRDELIEGKAKLEALEDAWEYFCNDSFWLNAPAKIMDEGTTRSVVKLKDGRNGLKVNYTSGGVTPGDSYLWFLDEKGLPTSYKMWTQIIPVGGVEFTWDRWIELPGGALISTYHSSEIIDIEITDIMTP